MSEPALDIPDILVQNVPPHGVKSFFPDIAQDLRVAITNSHDEITMTRVADFLRDGKFHLAVAADATGYRGFFIHELIPTDRATYLNIIFAGCDGLDALNAMFDHAEDFGYPMKWVSSNPKFQAYAKRRGYQPRFIEYIKEK